MKQIHNLIQKYSLCLLGLFLSLSIPLHGMESTSAQGTPSLAFLATEFNQAEQSNENATNSPSQESEDTKKFTFEHPINAAVILPHSQCILVGAHNMLHRVDTIDNSRQVLELQRPIAKLVPSMDGNLCATLLIPNKGENPEITFVNSAQNSLEQNNPKNPIFYCRASDYEIAQEADLSPDSCYLAVIETNNKIVIHDIKQNKIFTSIRFKQDQFPIYSVHFLKKTPNKQNILAVQINLETHLYLIGANGCQEIAKINHQKITPGINYAARQGAWLVNERVVARVAGNAGIYDHKGTLLQEFKTNKDNPMYPCPNDNNCIVELLPKSQAFRLHNLYPDQKQMETQDFCHTKLGLGTQIFCDKSQQLALCATDNTVMTLNLGTKQIIAQKKQAQAKRECAKISLLKAVNAKDLDSVKLNIQLGTSTNQEIAEALMQATLQGNIDIIELMLTTIPCEEIQKILDSKKAALVMHKKLQERGVINPPRDIRKIITNYFIDGLVEQQINRIKRILETKNGKGNIAHEFAKIREEIVTRNQGIRLVPAGNNAQPHRVVCKYKASELLDPNNMFILREIIEKGIKEILFGKPEEGINKI